MNVQLPSLHLSKQWFGTNWLLMWSLPNHAVAIQMKIINAISKEPHYSLKFNFLKSIHHTCYTLEEIYQEYIGFKWNVCIIYEILQNSVEFSHSVMSNSLRPHGLQHARPPFPLPTPGAYSNCPLHQLCHPTISSSVIPFSSYLQSFPASGSSGG